MEYQKVSSTPTFSRKLTNNRSFGGNSVYDGVFSSIPAVKKVSSRVDEDYGEIFGGSGGSSIPMLDVPELKERKVAVAADVNSSRLDYSKIFGGFGEFDFVASHEQIFATEPKRKDTSVEEKRTPAETGLHTSKISVDNQVFSRGASCQPFDGAKQFKMSYHKTNQGRENGINGTTHIAQLNAVPGYSCLINEVSPSKITEGDKPSSVLNKSYLNINFSGELMEGKDSRKAVSSGLPGGDGKLASGGAKFQKNSNQSRSNSIDRSFDAHEIGLRTHPLNVSPSSSQLNKLGKDKGGFERPVSSNFGVSKSHSSDGTAGFCSPPYFEEEIDSNSVAAASAAAVKKAIEEAQTKIRIAKEIMERKKEGLQNNVKLRFSDGLKAEKRREGNITNKSKKSREKASDKCKEVDNPVPILPQLGTINLMDAGQVTPDLRDRGKLFSTKEASGGTHEDKYKGDNRQEEMKDSEAEELGESRARMKRTTNVWEEEGKAFVDKTFEKPKENGKEIKVVEEAHNQEEVEKLNVVKGACELKECANERKSEEEVNDQKEYGTKSAVVGLQEEVDTTFKSTVAGLQEEVDTTFESTVAGLLEKTDATYQRTVAELHEETDMTSKASHMSETCEKKQRRRWNLTANEAKPDREVNSKEECEMKSTVAGLQEEADTTIKASHRSETSEKKQRRLWDLTANKKKLEFQELRDAECVMMTVLADEQKWLDNENKEELLELDENDIRSKDVPEREENNEELPEIFYDTENQDVLSTEDAEKTYDNSVEREKSGVAIKDFHDGEQSKKVVEESGEVVVKEKLKEAEENVEILREACEMKVFDNRQKESHAWLGTEKIQTTIEQRAADEKVEITLGSLNQSGNNLESVRGLCKGHKKGMLSETVEVAGHEENNAFVEILSHDEIGGIMGATRACREMEPETEFNADEMSDLLVEREVFEAKTADLPQVGLEFDKMKKHTKDTTENFSFEYNGVNAGITDIDVQQEQHHQHANESNADCNLGKYIEEVACDSEENFKDVEEVEVTIKQEEDESSSEFSDEERWDDGEEIMEASLIPNRLQEREETTEIANSMETSQDSEKDEGDHSETLTTEERDAEGTMQKKVEPEEEHVRKTDEAKEKERERKKERIAVERAIREARERAFTEARERAERAAVERANAEARQRAMAEAREKVEKVSAEATNKLSADKSSMEARLKAQRAAVERATVEARERALEKAMSEKAALEARNQSVKSSGASRDNGKRQNFPSNDSRYKGSGPTRSSGNPSSSNRGVAHSPAKSDKVDGEPAQKHKATWEKHQRTAERAAKALAEKNMRELLVQKEQAERNRLAESIDADVKRWSSGKQGNLRALLSTLQYILGPESGWQPVPLTELMTTTAIKKTYRKATLFVHPDKLQQRGASIQQKYICEKVFDILKEAWNKFSAEER